jgi:putative oxidoreductase
MRFLTSRNWFNAPPEGADRSLHIVRVVVALILLMHPLYALAHPADIAAYGQLIAHPLYALTHPGDMTGYGQTLQSQGLRWGLSLGAAWIAILLQLVCSMALLARRFVVPACIGHILVLAAGIWIVHLPHWYALGGAVEDGHPGAEFSVLLIACLAALLWAQKKGTSESEQRALDILRVASALILIAHPVHGVFDPEGLRGFGEGFNSPRFHHFQYGVPMVWTLMFFQIACCLAMLARRLVVPACLGHIFVLCMGIWISHAPRWFIVGPGENGVEYSLVFLACFSAVLLAHWPRRAGAEERGAAVYA